MAHYDELEQEVHITTQVRVELIIAFLRNTKIIHEWNGWNESVLHSYTYIYNIGVGRYVYLHAFANDASFIRFWCCQNNNI